MLAVAESCVPHCVAWIGEENVAVTWLELGPDSGGWDGQITATMLKELKVLEFPKPGALISNRNSRALITRKPRKGTPNL